MTVGSTKPFIKTVLQWVILGLLPQVPERRGGEGRGGEGRGGENFHLLIHGKYIKISKIV